MAIETIHRFSIAILKIYDHILLHYADEENFDPFKLLPTIALFYKFQNLQVPTGRVFIYKLFPTFT